MQYVREKQSRGRTYWYYERWGKRHRLHAPPGDPRHDAQIAEIERDGCAPREEKPLYSRDPSENMQRHLVAILRAARSRATAAGREFTITKEWLLDTVEAQNYKCAGTGLPMKKTRAKHDPWAPSIDRRDNALGYTPDNCRVVSYIYNCARNQFSQDDLLRLSKAIVVKSNRLQKNTPRTNDEQSMKRETRFAAQEAQR